MANKLSGANLHKICIKCYVNHGNLHNLCWLLGGVVELGHDVGDVVPWVAVQALLQPLLVQVVTCKRWETRWETFFNTISTNHARPVERPVSTLSRFVLQIFLTPWEILFYWLWYHMAHFVETQNMLSDPIWVKCTYSNTSYLNMMLRDPFLLTNESHTLLSIKTSG